VVRKLLGRLIFEQTRSDYWSLGQTSAPNL
jgi:hypothetical protein